MTRVLGLFGDPVGHSLSPIMHNRALKALEMDAVYLPFHVRPPDLRAALNGMAAMGMAGVNLTIPHKEAALPHLDYLSEESRLVGAVNTVHNVDGKLTGYSTDGRGFVRSLREEAGVDPNGLRFLLVGAGGAARSVAVQLGLEGAARIAIANRTEARAQELAHHVNRVTAVETEGMALGGVADVSRAAASADVVVNGTPLGLGTAQHAASAAADRSGEWSAAAPINKAPAPPLPLPIELLKADALVCDLVYVPLRTPWLQAAATAGHPVLSGVGMLLYQGAIALEIWTGREAPVSVMRQAIEEVLS